MAVSKCKVCKTELTKDNIRHKVSGGYRCDVCQKKQEKENKQWSDLYEYLKDKYFIKILPSTLIKELKDMRNSFNYKTILDCFLHMEDSLLHYYLQKSFTNDFQRSRYIMGALNKEIDGFYRKQIQSEKEAQELNKTHDIKIFKSNITKSESKNYDILD